MLRIGMLSAGSTTQPSKSNHYSTREQKNPVELIQKLAHWEAIFESSQDSIITKDLKGIVTSWNPASERIYGYSKEEIVGKSITILFPSELKKEFSKLIAKLKKGERIQNYDTVRVRKDGRKVHVSVSLSPIRNTKGKIVGVAGIAHDISDRIELEKRKDDFISIASHEFKTPLTTLKGFSQILLNKKNFPKGNSSLQKSTGLDNSQQLFLQKMDHQIDKLTQLVENLLDVSKIQASNVELKKSHFWLNELISEVVEGMQLQTKHQLQIKLNPKIDIYADRDKISQVLSNLLSNAIKYSPQADKVIIETKLDKTLSVCTSVRDFGIGIIASEQPKIFERFYQTKNKIRESFSGLGLGLYISNEIIKIHQGKIWVDSVKKEGSIFYIKLPIK